VHAVEARRLVRKFGDFVAVAGVEFEVRQGEVFGFLGPNGAGKSTTINMLCTMMRPSSGTAVINGHDVVARPDLVRQSIGIIFQDASLDDRLTGLENLRFHAMLYDIPRETFAARSKELLAMVDLADKAGEQVRTYSGGMKRRLEIARGLLHHPKVLFLDEPTIGLDPQTRRHIWQYLMKLRLQEGVTMFMTTHYMEEAEHCDRIAVIDHGTIVALDTPENLKQLVGGDIISVRTSDNQRAAARLKAAKAPTRDRIDLGLDADVGNNGRHFGVYYEDHGYGRYAFVTTGICARTGTRRARHRRADFTTRNLCRCSGPSALVRRAHRGAGDHNRGVQPVAFNGGRPAGRD
jgi:ABC-2 type transport system ATP-binding protein